MVPAAAQAGSAPDPTWTQQQPAVHPPKLVYPAMAYDAATGSVVLAGGQTNRSGTFLYPTSTWTSG